jgi:RND family efflux transporter MFP subunit
MKSVLKKISFLTIFTTLLMVGCQDSKSETKEATIKVTTARVNLLDPNLLFSTSGTIEATKSARISTRIMGYVYKVKVKIGDKVQKGDLLLSLNSADLKAKKGQINAQIEKAKSYFNNAKKDYERFKQLFKENSASQKELDNITTNYEQAKAGLEAALQMQKEIEANLAYANIKAPFDGVITGKFIDKGDLANPGRPLLGIENTSNYLVKAYVNENQIDKIHRGDAVNLKIKSTNQILEGVISEISISSKNSGGLYQVKIDIKNPKNIFSGMFVAVDFTGSTDNGTIITIPKSTLVNKGQLTGVYTVSMQNTAILRWLRLGKTYGNTIEVLSGLNKNESIITSADGKLYNGANVTLN